MVLVVFCFIYFRCFRYFMKNKQKQNELKQMRGKQQTQIEHTNMLDQQNITSFLAEGRLQ